MENQDNFPDIQMPKVEMPEPEPSVVFHAFPIEMWFWRFAVPVSLIIGVYNLLK